jgi:hypothetical protein
MNVEGRRLRMRVKLANQPGGGALGALTSVDEGLEAPVGIIQSGDRLKLDVRMLAGAYEGALSPAGDELVGTYATNGLEFPLNLKRIGN